MNRDWVKSFYADTLSKQKTPAARLGMQDFMTQRRSYQATINFVEQTLGWDRMSVHDAGCGHGAIHPLLLERGIVSYIGTDYLDCILKEGDLLYPKATKVKLDLLTEEMPTADITLLLGTFGAWDADDALKVLEKALEASTRAVVFYHWVNTPSSNPNYIEARLLEAHIDDFLSINDKTTKSMNFNFGGGDRLVIASHKNL